MQNFYVTISKLGILKQEITPIRASSTQPAITCSKLTTETLEQDVKYVQS